MLANLLIIDDSELCLSVIDTVIQESHLSEKVSVTLCQQALKAKELLTKQNFDLVITDIIMPDVEGYELISYIKERSQSSVLAISSGYGKEDPAVVLETAKKFGADEVLLKLNLRQELISTINQYILRAA